MLLKQSAVDSVSLLNLGFYVWIVIFTKCGFKKGASREKLIDAMVKCGGDKEGVEPLTVWEYHGVPLFKKSFIA